MGETILKLGPDDTGLRLSAAEYAAAEWQRPYRFERVHGRVVAMSPSGPEHRWSAGILRRELDAYWRDHTDVVQFVDFEGWVATSPDDDRLPDICVYLRGSADREKVPHRVPELIFEFVSESRRDQERDYIYKREEYHRVGVKEYVIVDRFKASALVLTWRKGDYAERVLGIADDYTSPLLPGFTVALRDVLTPEEGWAG